MFSVLAIGDRNMLKKKFILDGIEHQTDSLSLKGQEILSLLVFANLRLEEETNKLAVLKKAKNSYIEDIKREVIQTKLGVKTGELFD